MDLLVHGRNVLALKGSASRPAIGQEDERERDEALCSGKGKRRPEHMSASSIHILGPYEFLLFGAQDLDTLSFTAGRRRMMLSVVLTAWAFLIRARLGPHDRHHTSL